MTFGKERKLLAAFVTMGFVFAASPLVRSEGGIPVYRWTTNDGHFFQATFLRLQGTSIVVVRNGFEFTVPLSTLSPASREQARNLPVHGPVVIRATGAPMAIPVAPRAPVAMRAIPVAPTAPTAPLAPVASFSFGPSILTFCQDSLGKKIGSGQCASLASSALKNAGAAVRGGKDWPGEGDYVWGEPVATVKAGFYGARGVRELAHVEAGDIVQFHDSRFVGYERTGGGVYRMEAKHHTAVVESVDVAHATITVLHQNWNRKEIVRRQTLNLGGMTNGWLRFYHPIAAPQASRGGPIGRSAYSA